MDDNAPSFEIVLKETTLYRLTLDLYWDLQEKVFRSFDSGFVRVLEILKSPGILFWHFPGLESPGKLMQVLESPGNL